MAQLLYIYLESGRVGKSLPEEMGWLYDEDLTMHCVAFAAPSVVSCKMMDSIKDLRGNMVNFVFKNDPVPRCYGWKALVQILEEAAGLFSSAGLTTLEKTAACAGATP